MDKWRVEGNDGWIEGGDLTTLESGSGTLTARSHTQASKTQMHGLGLGCVCYMLCHDMLCVCMCVRVCVTDVVCHQHLSALEQQSLPAPPPALSCPGVCACACS